MAIRKELIDLKKDIYKRYNIPYDSNEEKRTPKFVFYGESIIDRMVREGKEMERLMGKQDQDVPGDKSKCFCYKCKKAFPIKEMVGATKEGNIASIDRTIINGIFTTDYNHYHRFNVLVCKKCAKEIKFDDYLLLFGKYGFVIPLVLFWTILACLLMTDAPFNSSIDVLVPLVIWVVISSLISCVTFNKRRFYIN